MICRAHARLGRRAAGQQPRPVARARAGARATGSPSGRTSSSPAIPGVFVVGDIAAITDAKTEQVLPQLGSVALQSGEHAGETIARRVAGKATKPFEYKDKGTMATIGRGAAVVQMLGGKTMKGRKAQFAWGTVHLALLPTNEDRAKAIVDWAGQRVHAPARGPDQRRRGRATETRERWRTSATRRTSDGTKTDAITQAGRRPRRSSGSPATSRR